jgi:WD40 repeat protein
MLARLLVQFLLCSNSTLRADNQDDTANEDEEEEEDDDDNDDHDASSQAPLQADNINDDNDNGHDKAEQHQQQGLPKIIKSLMGTNHKNNKNKNTVCQKFHGSMSPELLVDSSIANYLNRTDWNHLALMNRHVHHHMVVVRMTSATTTTTTNSTTNTSTTRHSNLVPPPWPTWTPTQTIPTTMTSAAASTAATTTSIAVATSNPNSNLNSTSAVILPVGILFYSMSLSSNEEWLACGCENGTIRFFHALYGPQLPIPPPQQQPQNSKGTESPNFCSSSASSTVEPASSTTTTTSNNHCNHHHHIPQPLTHSSPHQLLGHTNRVRKVLFSPTNPYLLVSSAQDGTVRIWWDIRPTSSSSSSSSTIWSSSSSSSSLLGDCVVSQSSSSSSSSSFASALAFTPNGQQVAIGQGSLSTVITTNTSTSTFTTTTGPRYYPPSVLTIISIWDLASQTCIHKWVAGEGQRSNFLSMAFWDDNSDGSGGRQFLATSRTTRSNQVCVWDVQPSSFSVHIHDKNGTRSTPPPAPPNIHLEGDSRETLSLAWWDSSTSSSLLSSAQSPCSETIMQTSSSSSSSSLLLAAGSWYSTIKIWTIPNGQCIQTLGRRQQQQQQRASSRNGTSASSSSSRPRGTTDSATWCLAFCPIGSTTTTTSNTTTTQQQQQQQQQQAPRLLLLDGRGDGSIRFWNVQDGSNIGLTVIEVVLSI